MKNKRKGNKLASIALSFMALCVFCGAGYVAKEADYAVYGIFGEEKAITDNDTPSITIVEDTIDEPSEYRDAVLIDDTSLLNEKDEISTNHEHVWVETIAMEHIKNSDGSCDMIYYNAEKCSICGKIRLKDECNSLHYDKCPH